MFKRKRRLRNNEISRNLIRETSLSLNDFIYPLFVVEGNGIKREIESMPGVFQMSIDNILKECEELCNLGLYAVMLFGVPNDGDKDSIGSYAYNPNAIVAKALREIKTRFTTMYIVVDLCFCEYTSHGHCGILDSKGVVDNDKTLEIIAKQSLVLAQNGADMIAPSGMMDGQIYAIRKILDSNNLVNIPIMSYSTKFASAFYGPFRDVANSAPEFGDRKAYQEDFANRREAISESLNDEDEGADILMIKPALSYLDIVRDVREKTLLPLAVYNVSGEYAILQVAKKAGVIDYEKIMLEMLISFKRAGADIIITYHAKEATKLI